tara:strand:+ start:1121 stop:1258 length:138 start_codon:yes stop_codon:yes gene_type:complete
MNYIHDSSEPVLTVWSDEVMLLHIWDEQNELLILEDNKEEEGEKK